MSFRFFTGCFAAFSGSLFAQPPAVRPRMWLLADGRDVEATLGKADPAKDGMAVSLKMADGKSADGILSAQDGHSLRYVANVRLAEGREFRDWHFDKLSKELADFPPTVRGAFLRAVCEDHQFSTASVELIRDDYTRRHFPLKTLRDDDREHALKLQAALDDAAKKSPAVPYSVKYEAYTPGRDAAVSIFRETEHFLLHWGNDKSASGKDWWNDDGQELTFAWFERVWRHFEAAGARTRFRPSRRSARAAIFRRGKRTRCAAGRRACGAR